MTIEERYNYQSSIVEGNNSSTGYSSDGSVIDQYVLATVQMKNSMSERIILDPAAYNALVNQASKDIESRIRILFKNWL